MNNTSWKAIYDSAKGTSHEKSGLPCQDACRVVPLRLSDGEWLVACAADGAGSASHSAEGAEIACDAFVSAVLRDSSRVGLWSEANRETALTWLCEARGEIDKAASRLGVERRELACTFLAAAIGESHSFFLQIGDGAIAIVSESGYEPVFWPQSGEFASTTNFLTDEWFEGQLEWRRVDRRVDEFAMFTDGLERLILRFADQSVHGPFLEPLFLSLRHTDQPEAYFEPLRAFLKSPRINERTDDDKTLVLATRLA